MRVATFNVNGIRAATRRGFGAWLADRRPDLLLLQEVRAPGGHVEALTGPGGVLGDFHVVHDEGDRVGRNGVAVLVPRTGHPDHPGQPGPPFTAVRTGLGGPEFETAGRWLEVDLTVSPPHDTAARPIPLTAVSVYVPTGQAGTPLQDAKQRFLDAMTARLAVLRADAARTGREVVVGGDLNVAAEEADIKAWKANLKHAGFLPAERDWLRGLTGAAAAGGGGWVDLVRAAHPGEVGPYSWWSWRGKAFDTDAGWRIDLLLATPGLAARARDARVDRAPGYAERISDHAPVLADLD